MEQLFTSTRRQFVKTTTAASAALALGVHGLRTTAMAGEKPAGITLPPLPYGEKDLDPHISARTISFHYGKHHAGYVRKLNAAVKGTAYEGKPLVDIITQSVDKPDDAGVFNNAAQVFNHTFYWNSMKPKGGGKPTGEIADRIVGTWASVEAFTEEFVAVSASQFGSGWGWLVMDGANLRVIKTANADTPIAHKLTPILTVDVWEHAYYLDYQNRRKDYIKAYLDNLVNWDFANANLSS